MPIQQFRYSADNLAYLVYDDKAAIAVDPGAVREMTDFLLAHGLQLQTIVNTHSHPDHTVGNRALLEETGAPLMDMAALTDRSRLELDGEPMVVYHTPGHTNDAVIFYCPEAGALITGDTLFTGKAGRCFTGDLARFLESIRLIMDFPDDTRIYGGHDYVMEYMATAKKLEPDNAAIDDMVRAYHPEQVWSTLAEEKAVNPTLRFNTDSLIAVMRSRGLPTATEYERWCSVMSMV